MVEAELGERLLSAAMRRPPPNPETTTNLVTEEPTATETAE